MLVCTMYILTLLAGALAGGLGPSTHSQQICRTSLATKKGLGGTTTKVTTQYLTRTVKTTITPILTITPLSATVTKHTTSVSTITKTLPQSTNTFSTTLSFTDIVTSSTTLIYTTTSTTVETTTSTFSTTTIQPSSGFVPLSSALAASGYTVAKKARRTLQDRSFEEESAAMKERATKQKIICNSDGSVSYDPPQYSGSVTCYKRVQVVTTKVLTSTAKKTKTVTASRGTITKTSIETKTRTVIVTPPVAPTTKTISVTSTVTTTLTSSSTTTFASTSTSTVYAPQPTYYAACSASNTVSFVNNSRIYNIATVSDTNGFSTGNFTTTAYDCCVQCQLTGTCGGSTFHPASGTCYFFPFAPSETTCDPTAEVGGFLTQTGTNVGFVVSNGNCGEVKYGAV